MDIIAAAVTLLQAGDTALIVTMVDIVVVRPCGIITMTNPGTMVDIGPLPVVELADLSRMITNLVEEDMPILMVLPLHAVIRMNRIRRTDILVAGLEDLLREAMNTSLGVIGEFSPSSLFFFFF